MNEVFVKNLQIILYSCLAIPVWGEASMASRFVGYREWKDADAKLEFLDVEKSGANMWKLKIEFSCPGATSYLLSQTSDLSKGEWTKMSAPVIGKTLRLSVHAREDLVTLWIVFKKKRSDGKTFEMSQPLGRSMHKKEPYRKIQLVKNGYIDWKEYQIVATGKAAKPADEYSRYGLGTAQTMAQESMSLEIQKIVRAIALNHVDRVQDYFHEIFSRKKNQGFLDLFAILPEHVYYPSKLEAVVWGRIFLWKEFPFFFQAASEALPMPLAITSITKGPVTGYKRIYVDTKGLFFQPCVFPEILSYDGRIICNRSMYHSDKPFVRYLQSPDETKGESHAYVKAKIIPPETASKVIIQQNTEVTTADWEEVINRGELYFLVD